MIPQGALREAVHGSAVGSPYTEAGFRELLNQALRPVYEQRGRVGVAFTEIRAEPVSDVVMYDLPPGGLAASMRK